MTTPVKARLRTGARALAAGVVRRFQLDTTQRFWCDFTHQETDAAVNVSTVRFRVRRPDGSIVVYTPSTDSAASGIWYLDLGLDQPGSWVVRATCTSPGAAADEIAVRVLPSSVKPTDSAPPWVDANSGAIITPAGQLVTAALLDQLPDLSAPDADDLIPVVRDGDAGTLTWASMAGAESVNLTADPAVTDDTDDGYSVFSVAQNTLKRRLFMAADVASGAARWLRLGVHARVPRRTGRIYACTDGPTVANVALNAASTLFLYPFEIEEKETLTKLLAWVQTGQTGGAFKMCLYADVGGLPVGAALAADSTGRACTSSGAAIEFSFTAVTLEPGNYWWGGKGTATSTLPTFVSIASQSGYIEARMGRGALLSANLVTGLSLAATYASAFPTLTGGEAWTDNVVGGIPALRRLVSA